jgi:hypothetical protein
MRVLALLFRESVPRSPISVANLDAPSAIQPLAIAVQPPIFTIPCKVLYSLANPMLPSSMFSSPATSNRSPRPHPLHPDHGHPACPERSRRERSEGSASRSVPATHHSLHATKLFRIHTSAKRARNSIGICTSKTQDLKPFRIRTYEKRGRVAPPSSVIGGTANPGCPLRGFASTRHGSPITNHAPFVSSPECG